jgi:[methyl-Co(III) methanol-specific corrinoid protein]:coenzyme M methyltransferase
VDAVPVGSPTSVATVDQMEITGAFFPHAHLDGEKMARLAAGAYEILGYDAIMPVFSVVQEAAALGCEISWGEAFEMPVAVTHPWNDPEQVAIPVDFLERSAIKTVLDALSILQREYGHQAAIIGKVMGPWTLAYAMHGLQDFLIETLLEPDKVRRFLDRLKAVTVLFGKAQLEAGADLLCLPDHATGDLVSGKMYRDFLAPIHREILAELGCPVILHICGKTLDRMPAIADAGFDAFHFDSLNDAQQAVRLVGDRLVLVGNVENVQTLLNGTPEAVAGQTRYAIEAGVQVIGPECAVPLRTPLENLIAIRRAARDED